MTRLVTGVIGLVERIPNTLIAFIGAPSIAAVFWKLRADQGPGLCGQSGLGVDSLWAATPLDSALALFQDEYKPPSFRRDRRTDGGN